MANLDNLFGAQINDLSRAMSRTTQRQSMLTDNLANVNTPGYKRKDMDFHITLEGEMSKAAQNFRTMQENSTARSDQGTSITSDGNNVDMEHEVMALAETELHYQTLAQMTNKNFSNLNYVIREGK